ncbi:MAG: aspartate aminotransferase family protein [Candidatus Spyradocola sp.]
MNLEQIRALDEQYYMNTFGKRLPVAFDHGSGVTLYDTEGRAYTDFFAGIAVNALGYAHPAVTAAIVEQAQKVCHTSNLYYIEPQAKLAKLLVENSFADKVFFGNSGAEANEGCMKLAIKYFYEKGEDRFEILSANNSFHGRTLATIAATGQKKYQKPYVPLLPSCVKNVPFGDLDALRAAFTPHTAAVMLEVIQAEGGVIVGSKDYIQGVRKLCDETGALLIIDEVQTGMGRCGTLFAHELYGIEPDILSLAKALGGGVPIGAVLAKDEVAKAFHPGDHGSTFGGNPLACAAALAVVQTMLEEDIPARAKKTGAHLKAGLNEIAKRHPDAVQDVRGEGLLLGVALSEAVPAGEVVSKLLEKGFVTGTAAGNVLRLLPPLVIGEADCDALCAALDGVLAGK